jgi:hypothetical protein
LPPAFNAEREATLEAERRRLLEELKTAELTALATSERETDLQHKLRSALQTGQSLQVSANPKAPQDFRGNTYFYIFFENLTVLEGRRQNENQYNNGTYYKLVTRTARASPHFLQLEVQSLREETGQWKAAHQELMTKLHHMEAGPFFFIP